MPRRKSKRRIVRMPVGEPKAGLTREDMALVEMSLRSTVADGTRDSLPQAFLLLRGLVPAPGHRSHGGGCRACTGLSLPAVLDPGAFGLVGAVCGLGAQEDLALGGPGQGARPPDSPTATGRRSSTWWTG